MLKKIEEIESIETLTEVLKELNKHTGSDFSITRGIVYALWNYHTNQDIQEIIGDELLKVKKHGDEPFNRLMVITHIDLEGMVKFFRELRERKSKKINPDFLEIIRDNIIKERGVSEDIKIEVNHDNKSIALSMQNLNNISIEDYHTISGLYNESVSKLGCGHEDTKSLQEFITQQRKKVKQDILKDAYYYLGFPKSPFTKPIISDDPERATGYVIINDLEDFKRFLPKDLEFHKGAGWEASYLNDMKEREISR